MRENTKCLVVDGNKIKLGPDGKKKLTKQPHLNNLCLYSEVLRSEALCCSHQSVENETALSKEGGKRDSQ